MSLLGDLGAPVTALSVLGTSRQEKPQTTTDRQRPVGSGDGGCPSPEGTESSVRVQRIEIFVIKRQVKSWLRCLIDKILDTNFNFQEP